MTERTAGLPWLRMRPYAEQAGKRVARIAALLGAELARVQFLRALPLVPLLVSSRTLRLSILAIPALFLLAVAAWYGFELSGHDPVGYDDLRLKVYANEMLRGSGNLGPGSTMVNFQLPFIQSITYSSVIWLFGWEFPLALVPFFFSVALAGLVGYTVYKITGDLWLAILAVLVLASAPVVASRARALSFYPAALFFGYLGLVAAVAYLRGGGRASLVAAVGGLAGALYSFNIGVLFLPVPLLFLLVDHTRTTLVRASRLYGFVVAVAIPFLVWHLAIGGPSRLFSQELRWTVSKGYLQIRNEEFFSSGSASYLDFMGKIPGMFDNAYGVVLLPMLALGIVGVVALRKKSWQAAVLVAVAIPIAALIYKSPMAAPRYVFILLPGLILLGVYGLSALFHKARSQAGLFFLEPLVGTTLIVLLGLLVLNNPSAKLDKVSMSIDSPASRERADMASLIDDDRAVLGTRALSMISFVRDNKLLGPAFMTEDDFVTYLSWRSDRAVRRMFKSNDVGWVLIKKPAKRWEQGYHLWLERVTGTLPRHHSKLKQSKLVDRVYKGKKFDLYRVN